MNESEVHSAALEEYERMLQEWRFHPVGDEQFLIKEQYTDWSKRFGEVRAELSSQELVTISKKIGWKV